MRGRKTKEEKGSKSLIKIEEKWFETYLGLFVNIFVNMYYL